MPLTWLLVVCAVPWLADASACSLPSPSHGLLPVCVRLSLCLSFPFFEVVFVRVHTNDLILTSAKSLFPNKVTYTGTGG